MYQCIFLFFLNVILRPSTNIIHGSISPTGTDKYISGSGYKAQTLVHSNLESKITSLTSQVAALVYYFSYKHIYFLEFGERITRKNFSCYSKKFNNCFF